MKRIIIILFISLILLSGCGKKDSPTGSTKQDSPTGAFVYESYSENSEGMSCLDEDKDKICDEVESIQTKVLLTDENKLELCKGLRLYIAWCFDNGIPSDECARQSVENIMRKYNLDINQIQDLFEYCAQADFIILPDS